MYANGLLLINTLLAICNILGLADVKRQGLDRV